jgi:hypothetical protein
MKVRMTLQFPILIIAVVCAAMPLAAQSAGAEVYAESFRKGSTHVIEESFEVKLTPQDRLYRERIKDAQGADRFVFSILPKGPEGDTQITSWQLKLVDLHHPIYDNVLMTSPEPSLDSSDPKDALWMLEPGRFAPVPVDARRIVKVDSFYVVVQVKAHHFTPPDSPYLDSMTVTVEFKNKDPRQAEGSGK